MDLTPVIAVIVPVYNTEKYLRQCLDSLLNQTYKDFEVICVNDGSTDSSGSILEEYSNKDKRIKVIHKNNGGLSSARNTGLDEVKSPFVMFLDSDDTIEPTTLSKVYSAFLHNDIDFVCFNMEAFADGNTCQDVNEMNKWLKVPYEHSKVQDLTFKRMRQTNIHACNKAFKMSIIQDKIRFKKGFLYEDIYFTWYYMLMSKKVYYISENLYNYRIHQGSIMEDTVNELKFDKAKYHMKNWYELVVDLYKNDNEVFIKYANDLLSLLDRYVRLTKLCSEEIYYDLICNLKQIYVNMFNSLMNSHKVKVSILVPCYNVEKYLKQCLDSIINQTLRDIEIICINDGSTDTTPQILDEYAKNDSRIKVIHKSNSGYGASMNIGLDVAIGEYIGIVESDDFVELNMFETLYNKAKENSLDLVRCQYYCYKSKDNSNELFDNSWVTQNKIYCPLEKQTPFYQAPAIWSNLFSNKMIKENNIRFLETSGASYQDTSFAFKLYACSKKFMMIKDALLHYRIDNENSSVNSIGKVYCVMDEYAEIKRFSKEKKIYEKVRKLIPRIKYSCYCWNYERLPKTLKWRFLWRWHNEYLKDFIEGNFDKKLFNKKDRKRINTIIFFPWFYIYKRSL